MENTTVVRAAKLLRELETEAWKRVVAALENGVDNTIKFKGFVFMDGRNFGRDTCQWELTIVINDKDIKLEGEIKADVILKSNYEIAPLIIEAIQKEISVALTNTILVTLNKVHNGF